MGEEENSSYISFPFFLDTFDFKKLILISQFQFIWEGSAVG